MAACAADVRHSSSLTVHGYSPPALGTVVLPSSKETPPAFLRWQPPADIVAVAVDFFTLVRHVQRRAFPYDLTSPHCRLYLSRTTSGACLLAINGVSLIRPLLNPFLREPTALQWIEGKMCPTVNTSQWQELQSEGGRLFSQHLDNIMSSSAPKHQLRLVLHRYEFFGRPCFYEWWDNWDVLHPTKRFTRAEYNTNLSPESMMGKLHVFLQQMTECHGSFYYHHGPSPNARVHLWDSSGVKNAEDRSKCEQNRQRLVSHLVTISGVVLDWNKEPYVPWKGQRFFHGSPNMSLQTDSGGVSHFECRLHWNGSSSAFTTPHFSKAICYSKGVRVYTYELCVAGDSLRILDLRTDDEQSWDDTVNSAPFRAIQDIAGIEDRGSDRRLKSRALSKLFRDTDVAGAIMNYDSEWIWFCPAQVLRWVAPTNPGSLVQLLHDDLRSVNKLVPTKGWLGTFIRDHSHVKKMTVPLASIALMVCAREENLHDPNWSQYLATPIDYSAHWIPSSIHGKQDELIDVYECEYITLMQAMHPDGHFENQLLSTYVSGGHDHSLLPSSFILSEWNRYDVTKQTLLIRLPSGAKQFFPPLTSYEPHQPTNKRHIDGVIVIESYGLSDEPSTKKQKVAMTEDER